MVEVIATRTRVLIGDTVNLTCNVTTGDPSYANYTWTFMSARLQEVTNVLMLTINNASNFGNYICEATNVAGSGSGTISIEQGGIIMLTNVNVI
ncbi:MAG: immunoglobulin domain-containing protein [Proteobacteria bacterium]|nr:immunoglobulin domain-containing protein [Pseudomonadota bacterium]